MDTALERLTLSGFADKRKARSKVGEVLGPIRTGILGCLRRHGAALPPADATEMRRRADEIAALLDELA